MPELLPLNPTALAILEEYLNLSRRHMENFIETWKEKAVGGEETAFKYLHSALNLDKEAFKIFLEKEGLAKSTKEAIKFLRVMNSQATGNISLASKCYEQIERVSTDKDYLQQQIGISLRESGNVFLRTKHKELFEKNENKENIDQGLVNSKDSGNIVAEIKASSAKRLKHETQRQQQ